MIIVNFVMVRPRRLTRYLVQTDPFRLQMDSGLNIAMLLATISSRRYTRTEFMCIYMFVTIFVWVNCHCSVIWLGLIVIE